MRRLKITVALLTAIMGIPAQAGIKDAIESMVDLTGDAATNSFNLMGGISTYYDDGSVLDANSVTNRLGYIGPTASLRTPVKDLQLFSFSPPTISYGCSGIDMTLGAFSMVSLDELIALYRAIPQNALSYGFGQALHGMCPTCWSMIRDFQEQIDTWNREMKSSCELARAGVDRITRAWDEYSTKRCNDKVNAGDGDAAKCRVKDKSTKSESELQKEANEANAANGIELKESDIQQTGSFISSMVKFAADASTHPKAETYFKGNIHKVVLGLDNDIEMRNLLSTFFNTIPGIQYTKDSGSGEVSARNDNKAIYTADNYEEALINATGKAQYYQCETHAFKTKDGTVPDTDPLADCIDSSVQDSDEEESFDTRVKRLFESAVTKLKTQDFATLTSDEKAVISFMPPTLVRIVQLSNVSQRAKVASALNTVSDNVALLVGAKFIDALVEQTRKILKAYVKDKSPSESNIAMIDEQLGEYAQLSDALKQKAEKSMVALYENENWKELSRLFETSLTKHLVNVQETGTFSPKGK